MTMKVGLVALFFPWVRMPDMADLITAIFALLLWLSVMFTLFCLGVRSMFGTRPKRSMHKKAAPRH